MTELHISNQSHEIEDGHTHRYLGLPIGTIHISSKFKAFLEQLIRPDHPNLKQRLIGRSFIYNSRNPTSGDRQWAQLRDSLFAEWSQWQAHRILLGYGSMVQRPDMVYKSRPDWSPDLVSKTEYPSLETKCVSLFQGKRSFVIERSDTKFIDCPENLLLCPVDVSQWDRNKVSLGPYFSTKRVSELATETLKPMPTKLAVYLDNTPKHPTTKD